MKRTDSHQHTTRCLLNSLLLLTLVTALPLQLSATVPDPVLEWVGIMNATILAGGTNPLASTRNVALVAGSMFDAVNGINPHYTPLHVRPHPSSASQRAAAVQAAYAILLNLYPSQAASLAASREVSLTAVRSEESATAVAAGVAWGQRVANNIWNWRLNDGLVPNPPPFRGVESLVGTALAVGAWRPTSPVYASGAGPQFSSMTPWVLGRPGQFRLPPPLALTDPGYLADYNEIRVMGIYNGSGRTSDQSELALFWAGNTPLYWNRIAMQMAVGHSLSLSQNAHLFALLDVAMADAGIACWDSKYRYVFWRPITAIRDPASDNPDPTWEPWLDFFPAGTPAHPEYPSGHSTVSGAAAYVLTNKFGDNTTFTVTSEVRSGTRSFPSFSAAVAEIADARVLGGIHFRTSCVRGNLLGRAVASYVLAHSMR